MSKTQGTGSIDRSARVRRIKRVIIGLIATVVLLPSVLCVMLFAKLSRLERQITELSYQKEIVNVVTESTTITKANKSEPASGLNERNIKVEELTDDSSDKTDALEEENESSDTVVNDNSLLKDNVSDETSDDVNTDVSDVREDENEELPADSQLKLKKVYLTFDDGPSSNTGKILDILNSYGVKGTFFVVGRLSDTTTPMYKRIVNEGHTIAMHSYTHKYDEIYASTDAFINDIDRIQSLIYEQTGVLSKIYRFPGGSSNHVSRTDVSLLTEELKKRDIAYYDWNVVSGDASSRFGLPKDQLVYNCTQKALGFEEAVILMHDLPEKATTVEALPEIIEYFQNLGVEIAAIDENTAEVHHDLN